MWSPVDRDRPCSRDRWWRRIPALRLRARRRRIRPPRTSPASRSRGWALRSPDAICRAAPLRCALSAATTSIALHSFAVIPAGQIGGHPPARAHRVVGAAREVRGEEIHWAHRRVDADEERLPRERREIKITAVQDRQCREDHRSIDGWGFLLPRELIAPVAHPLQGGRQHLGLARSDLLEAKELGTARRFDRTRDEFRPVSRLAEVGLWCARKSVQDVQRERPDGLRPTVLTSGGNKAHTLTLILELLWKISPAIRFALLHRGRLVIECRADGRHQRRHQCQHGHRDDERASRPANTNHAHENSYARSDRSAMPGAGDGEGVAGDLDVDEQRGTVGAEGRPGELVVAGAIGESRYRRSDLCE